MDNPSGESPKGNSSSISDTSLQRGENSPSKITTRSDVKSQFFSIVQERLMSATREGRHKAAWRGDDAADYAPEMQIFREHYKPILWGISSAFLTFATFRFSKFTGPLARKSNGVGFTFQKKRSSNQLSSNSWMADGGKEIEKNRLLKDASSIPIDLGLSIIIGFSTTMFLLDYDKLVKDISHVPLVSGRSFVSHELCGPFIQQYQRIPKDVWKRKISHNQQQNDDATLKAIRTFVHNCQRRRIVEKSTQHQSLQSGSGFSNNDSSKKPIYIRGVPWNIEINEYENEQIDDWTSEN